MYKSKDETYCHGVWGQGGAGMHHVFNLMNSHRKCGAPQRRLKTCMKALNRGR